ncbi:MAG TPA: protein kinase [Ktedonobacteraceae bacterium]|nr:protein kinase [Ktedonobacteraceae bacterium]
MPRCPNPRCQADYPSGTTQCTNPFCLCLLPEAVVAGRYRIETLIGIGGMGAVYRVSDTFEMKQVALKVLSLITSVMDPATAVERFRREARYAHQLKHKNLVPVLNFGQDGQLLYLVMPLVTGGTLKALLKAERPLPVQQAQRYVNELAQAIDTIHAHPQQIVHRDIKPSNLLIHQDDGRLVVADFGIARAMQQEKPLTQRGWSVGTEHYIAPEQEQGKAEPASDIYAMGVVTYQMFTGLLPFQAVVRNRAAELPTPSALNEALPVAVDAVVLKALEIEPAKRYQTGKAFAAAINAALQDTNKKASTADQDTLLAVSSANVMVQTIIPENPCGQCGRENRPRSRFCRHCGHTLDDTSPLVTDVCQVGYVSDESPKQQNNEDMLLVVQGLCITLAPPPRPFSLLAVADGLSSSPGRVARGHEASRLAIETIADTILPQMTAQMQNNISSTPVGGKQARFSTRIVLTPETTIEQWLHDGVQQANRVIYHCNADYDSTMASTLTTAILYKHRLYIANIGDSRAYHYSVKGKNLRCITRDATSAANGAAAHRSRSEEVQRHQNARYLGQNYRVPVDLYRSEVETGDLVLLCTDGLWHSIQDQHLQKLLAQEGDTQQIAYALVETAKAMGSNGDTSVIVARAQ